MRPSPRSSVLEVLLDLLVETRGTPAAAETWRRVTTPFWNRGSWRDAERIMRWVQATCEAGYFSPIEKFYLLASLGDVVALSRARENPRFVEVDRSMDRVKREHGLGDDQDWYLRDAPAEYVALNTQYMALEAQEMADWYASLGEHELAYLIVNDPDRLAARWEVGLDVLVGAERG